MRVGWLADNPGYLGGAELTQAEFRAAAPVETVDCPPGGVVPGLDHYVAHNVTKYRPADIAMTRGEVTWFHHDLSPFIQPGVKRFLDENASHIFCSPLHREKYRMPDAPCVPPPVDLDAFKPSRQTRRHRKGTCSIAGWRGPGKGARPLAEWAAENGPVDVYGGGQFPPLTEHTNFKGPIAPDQVANTLWRYARMVFLPLDVEPFCRCVLEAHAAGCEVITNKLVGARYYIENDLDAVRTAKTDFWEIVL